MKAGLVIFLFISFNVYCSSNFTSISSKTTPISIQIDPAPPSWAYSISQLRYLRMYWREYRNKMGLSRCTLLASRCLRWLHWNTLTCSTMVKQMDWYKQCVIVSANTTEGKELQGQWLSESKVYHRGLFDCITKKHDSYWFEIKMPIHQIMQDAAAMALCIKFHADEWEDCLSSSMFDCSTLTRCWKKQNIQDAKEETEMRLNKYYAYLISACPMAHCCSD